MEIDTDSCSKKMKSREHRPSVPLRKLKTVLLEERRGICRGEVFKIKEASKKS